MPEMEFLEYDPKTTGLIPMSESSLIGYVRRETHLLIYLANRWKKLVETNTRRLRSFPNIEVPA